MAVRDEEAHLEQAARSVLDNGFAPGVELVIAVGPSRDGTAGIAAALARDPRVTLVDNPSGLTPQGLNAAIGATRREVLVRVDGHTVLPAGYIEQGVRALVETGAANAGGRMVPVGDGPWQRAVAAAMSSRWGIGGVSFHVGGAAGPAETVFLGVFRRAALEAVGGYDEHFLRAQDWELNHRLRQAGYEVWFEPGMAVEYRPRASLGALARQFHASGRWRREVVRRHPGTLGARYLAPPLAVAAMALGPAAGIAGAAWGVGWLWLGFLAPLGYAAGVSAVSLAFTRSLGWSTAARVPAVLSTMHVAWGLGFWRGMR